MKTNSKTKNMNRTWTGIGIAMVVLLLSGGIVSAATGLGGGTGSAKSISSTASTTNGSIKDIQIGKYINFYNNSFPYSINPQDNSFSLYKVDKDPVVLIILQNLYKGGRVQFDWYDNKNIKISSYSYYWDIPDPKSKGYSYWSTYSVADWPNTPITKSGHYYVKITTPWGNIDQSPKDATCTLAAKGCSFDVIPTNSILKIPEDMPIRVPLIPYGGKDILTLPFEGGGEELIRELSAYKNNPSIENPTKTIEQEYGKGFPYIKKDFPFQAPGYAPVHATTVNDMSNTVVYDQKTGKYLYDYWGECVSFVKTMTLNNLNTNTWYAGNYVMKMADRDITPGTAVAIFSQTRKDNGLPLYNGDCIDTKTVSCSPRHVALFEGFIYDDKDKTKKVGFKVFDQNYDSNRVVEVHNINTSSTNSKQYDDANAYRVVDWMDTRLLAR